LVRSDTEIIGCTEPPDCDDQKSKMAFSFCLSDPSFKTALKGKPDWNGPLACSLEQIMRRSRAVAAE
jgi:hypothetical protein